VHSCALLRSRARHRSRVSAWLPTLKVRPDGANSAKWMTSSVRLPLRPPSDPIDTDACRAAASTGAPAPAHGSTSQGQVYQKRSVILCAAPARPRREARQSVGKNAAQDHLSPGRWTGVLARVALSQEKKWRNMGSLRA
jgi:hypothetical protein